MQKITPLRWFDGKDEQAMHFDAATFKHSKVSNVVRYGDAGPGPKGSVMTAAFQLDGVDLVALNGGPQFSVTPAISFVADCATQGEIDRRWEQLSAGGEKQRCGWLKDKYGVS